MFKKIFLFFAIFLFCCGDASNPEFIERSDDGGLDLGHADAKFQWICYNPDSIEHGKVCNMKLEPGICLISGDSSKFCWKLDLSNCGEDENTLYRELCK
jgi:hypothetical protein